uniref:ABC transporter, ATP-binding protein n=1 Tax=uncultured bacterium contig00006 TaxID=1181498 RepID=A0A806KBM4_9BACT|nr:ABC transporter, ATP-binding protein [uncultured bacterium contig00006]
MKEVLRVEKLTKRFGDNTVLDGLSFSVTEGTVFGFVGANGAGKTTTMKIVLGLLDADGGSVHVCGERVVFGHGVNRHIGYLPDVPEFYGYMRPAEYLRYCGQLARMDAELIKSRSDELLGLVGLLGVNRRIGGFSRGMKQRLGVAQALINEPKLLICDEPTSALDPPGRSEILEILRAIRGKTTVIFSTHILSDVERICDSAAVLKRGRIALSGRLDDLRAGRGDGTAIEFACADDRERFMSLPDIGALYDIQPTGERGVIVRALRGDIERLLMEVIQ